MHVVKGLSLKLMSLLVLVLLGVAVGAADDSVNIPVVELEEALRGSRAWSLRTGFLADDLPVVAATSVIATHRFPGAPLQSIHNLVDNVAAEALQTAAVKSAASSPEGRASLAAVQAALNQRSRTGPSGVSHSLSSLYFLVQELLTRRLGLPVQEWPKSTLYRSVVARLSASSAWSNESGVPPLTDWSNCDVLGSDCIHPASFSVYFQTLNASMFVSSVRAVCSDNSTGVVAPRPPPLFVSLSFLNDVSNGQLGAALGWSANGWIQDWHRATEATPSQARHLISPTMLLLHGLETTLALLVAKGTSCWGRSPPPPSSPVDVVMLEEEAGLLLHSDAAVGSTPRDVWLSVASVSSGNFRLYRPYPLVSLTPDAFQVLPVPPQLPNFRNLFERTDEVFHHLPIEELVGASVLDFGANLGQSSVRSLLSGAASAVAVEGWHETAAVGSSLASLVNLRGLSYVSVNFNDLDFDIALDAVVPSRVDIVLMLAIYRNVGLHHRDRMLHYALRRASRGVVIEGHADSVLDSVEYYYWVLKQHGCPSTAVTYLGHTVALPTPSRPLLWVSTQDCTLITPPFEEAIQRSRNTASPRR